MGIIAKRHEKLLKLCGYTTLQAGRIPKKYVNLLWENQDLIPEYKEIVTLFPKSKLDDDDIKRFSTMFFIYCWSEHVALNWTEARFKLWSKAKKIHNPDSLDLANFMEELMVKHQKKSIKKFCLAAKINANFKKKCY